MERHDDRRPRAGSLIRRRALALFLFALVGASSLLYPGCSVDEGPLPINLAPTIYLSIQAETLRVTNYHTILNWWGTDVDGSVIGYAYRWSAPWQPDPEDSLWWDDNTWVFSTATIDTFDLPVQGMNQGDTTMIRSSFTFEVLAIDDDLLSSAAPLTQDFRVENWPPSVEWTDVTRHPTIERPSLPAISFAWAPEDFDGRRTISHTHLWLDIEGDEDPALSEVYVAGADTIGAFFEEHFQGRYGPRTIYLQVYDDAASSSDTISWTWNVTAPLGEYLIIDNCGESTPNGPAYRQDKFWRQTKPSDPLGVLDELFGENMHLYDVWEEGVFRSAQEVLPTLSLFKGVIWYGTKYHSGSGPSDEQMVAILMLAEAGLYDYVAGGGHLLITGLNVIGTEGGLSDDFVTRTFGAGAVYEYWDTDAEQFFTNITLPSREYVQCGAFVTEIDSIKVSTRISMTDYFSLGLELEPVFSLPAKILDQVLIPEAAPEEQVHVGAIATWDGGKLCLCSTLLTQFDDDDSANPEADPIEMVKTLIRYVFDLQ